MQLTVKTNFPDVQRALDRLQSDVHDKATASAINKTLDQAKTQMVKEITSEFNVKAAYVRDRLRIKRATSRGTVILEGALIGGNANGKRSANIIAFVEKVTTLAQGRKRAKLGTLNKLYVKVLRAGGSKPLQDAFIGNKGRTVFERVGPGRLPIKPVQVIDIAQMFNTKRINARVVAGLTVKFPAIFAREAKFFTDRFNAGRA